MNRKITDIFKEKDITFSFEVFPAKTPEGELKLYDTIKELSALKPDFISCTYGAGGGNREKTLKIAEYIIKECKIPAMAHLTCITHTKDEIKTLLKNIYEKGIRNILALRGDPPFDNPALKPGTDNYKHSEELVACIKAIYNGEFSVGVAGFPEIHPLSPDRESDIKYLKQKLDRGADFVITQLFFENNDYYNYAKFAKDKGITKRIIPGILPITSYPGLIKFCNNCGTTIPEKVHKIFAPYAEDKEKTIELGIQFAIEQCKDLLKNGASGIHFYTLNKVSPVNEILNAVR